MLDERKGIWKSGKGRGRDRPKGRPARRRGARRGPPPPRRPAAPARPPDRVPAPDPGRARPPLRGAPPRPRRGAAPRPGRGLGGRDLLRPFRRGEGRRGPAAAAHRPGLRLALLRARRRRRPSRRAARGPRSRARSACCRAPCMGRCDMAPTAEVGHFHVDRATPEAVQAAIAAGPPPPDDPALRGPRRLPRGAAATPTLAALRGGEPRRRDEVAEALLAAGLRGLGGAGFPDRAQVDRGACPPRPALPRGQRRRGRARHLQGPLLSRAHPAPDARGPADRRLGGRGGARLHLPARRIPRGPRDPPPRDRRPGGGGPRRPRLRRAPPRRRRLHLRRGVRRWSSSIEGKRGLPRHRPPYVAEVGLFGRPTLVQNVETLHWVARICREGPGGARRPRAERPQGPAQLLGLRAGWRGPASTCCPRARRSAT